MVASNPAVSAPDSVDAHLAGAIARAEAGRGMLERLAAIGMELAEEIRERNVQAPLHPEPRHDPARAFALVSRAVRLTLAFVARVDMDILAMRKNEPTSFTRAVAGRRSAAAPDGPVAASVASRPLGPEALRVRDAVQSAIHAKFDAWNGAMGALDELHERLIEYEIAERFVDRPWRECVDAICADLGLQPDWSGWSEETGFAAPPGKPNVKWNMLWSYDPKRSEARRRRTAERPGAGVAPTSSCVRAPP